MAACRQQPRCGLSRLGHTVSHSRTVPAELNDYPFDGAGEKADAVEAVFDIVRLGSLLSSR